MNAQILSQRLDADEDIHPLDDLYPILPEYITNNLKDGLVLRPYQHKALKRFLFYKDKYKKKMPLPTHLLYRMATGSGKTVIMASLILELYQRGYRNFLFFVNSDNIVQKTKENFLNQYSNKYLFSDRLIFNDKEIVINQVDNFDFSDHDAINIHFTTTNGLHSSIHKPKENGVTIEDFEDKKIVLISDEAHHINAETKKKLNKGEQEAFRSWEGTIKTIFNQNLDNILLEFTATIDLENNNIAEKYKDKIIYDYDLKAFRQDGYSKEVNIVEVDHKDVLERAFGAVLLSQYRRKIAQKYGLNVKPVILLKSKKISDSQAFREVFHNFIDSLTVKDIEEAKQRLGQNEPFKSFFDYLNAEQVNFDNFIIEVQGDFDKTKSLDINDTKELVNNQILVNSLEDRTNEIRVVFAVDKLNEGWDVLNLFDIVRLYDTRDSGKTTNQEAQLIGRGARYCPFAYGTDNQTDMRKFDKDLVHELRILEELHYHSPHIPKYISEIRSALIKTGIIDDKRIRRTLKLKESFKETSFYTHGYIYKNAQKKFNKEAFKSFQDYDLKKGYEYNLGTGSIQSHNIFADIKIDKHQVKTEYHEFSLMDFGGSLIRMAIDKLPFYRFENLTTYFHGLDSVRYFIELKTLLHQVTITIKGSQDRIQAINNFDKINAIIDVLTQIEHEIKGKTYDFIGTKDFMPELIKNIINDKVLSFSETPDTSDAEFGKSMQGGRFNHVDLLSSDWYVFNDCFGTSEEKHFIEYIYAHADKLKNLYNEFYLIRNERHFKIYGFNDGKPFEPDFVLFLTRKDTQQSLTYQIFIEPKGEGYIDKDRWKENFLNQIDVEPDNIFSGKKYHIYGLPFYTKEYEDKFHAKCKEIVGI